MTTKFKVQVTRLDVEIGKGSQDVIYTEIVRLYDPPNPEAKVRFTIKSDSYAFQSYARAHLFTNGKWEHLCDIHFSQMKTPHQLYVAVDPYKEGHFTLDRQRLLQMAIVILF